MSSTTETQKTQAFSTDTTMSLNLNKKDPSFAVTTSANTTSANTTSADTMVAYDTPATSSYDTSSNTTNTTSDDTMSVAATSDAATPKTRWELAVERVLKAEEEAWERCEKLTREEECNMMAGGNPEMYQWLMSYKWTEAKDLPADYWDDV